MSPRRPLLLVTFALALGACRADDEDCRDLARHIVAVAEVEGKTSTAGTAVALENDCKTVRPTKRLLDCMMSAHSLAEINEC